VKIACLHTLASNADLFEAARPPGVELTHLVRTDLLEQAERSGGMTAQIEQAAVSVLLELAAGADAVLLTCSTIGPAADAAAGLVSVPVVRTDASLARAAVARGGPVVVLCAVETTVAPSRRLFEAAAAETGARIDVQVVPDAWAAFRAGRIDRYHALVAAYADDLFDRGASTVALAQASMSGAVASSRKGHLLASPEAGIRAAAEAVARRR